MSMYADGTKLNISMGERAVLESDHFRSAGVEDMSWLDVTSGRASEVAQQGVSSDQATMHLCVCTHDRLSTG